ncbi:PAS domain S-box-containing protein [Kitasatospora sp. MAP12-15]|nr:PAS domain S-box-containing protein [Kitasatospora sp. MAP12-44]
MTIFAPELVDLAQVLVQEPGGSTQEGPQPGRTDLDMACLDRSLTIQQANHEFFRRFGRSSVELCGRTFSDLVHPSVQQPLQRQFSGLLEGRRDRFATEVIAVGADDTAFTVPLTAVAVRDGSPDVTAILVMMTAEEGSAPAAGAAVASSRKKILSEIDARILEGIAAGVSTVPLASKLYLSRQGVEYHVTCLLRKLRVPNRAALVSRAYSMGVLKVGVWPPKVVQEYVK